jgi:hypothetical protein
MSKFKIYGDYGYTTETLLEEFDTRSEAVRWAERYVESGDFGGYTMIEIAWFAEDGEYMVERRFEAEDYEDLYEEDTEGYLWDEF